MPPRKQSDDSQKEVKILPLIQGIATFGVVGTRCLVFHRMAQKAQRELLSPHGRKSKSELELTVKHDPEREYRESVYRDESPAGKTLLEFRSSGFRGAMCEAAIPMPGVAKTDIVRLITMPSGEWVPIYGIPKMFITVKWNSGFPKTPDIRTRARLEEWACILDVGFIKPHLTPDAVANLLAAAGLLVGVGDDRAKQEFGRWRITDLDDPDLNRIMNSGGRVAQEEALQNFEYTDRESQDLHEWYIEEMKRRSALGKATSADKKTGKALPGIPVETAQHGAAGHVNGAA